MTAQADDRGAVGHEDRPVHVLAVDDEHRNRVVLDTVLESDDWSAIVVDSGPAALRELLTHDVAVIVLDVRMGGMDGFETAELVRSRERTRTVPIIFLTANANDDEWMRRAYELGAVDYLVKPFAPEILRTKVSVFVELHRRTEQVRQQAAQLADTTGLLRSVLENTADYAIDAVDLDGRCVLWSPGSERLYGYASDEAMGHDLIGLLHPPDDAADGAERLTGCAERDGRADGEFVRVRKDGTRFIAAVTRNERLDAAGARVGFVEISRDVTAFREAEAERTRLAGEHAAREEAEQGLARLRAVVEVMPQGVVVAGGNGRIYLANAAAVEILGRVPEVVAPGAGEQPRAWTPQGAAVPAADLPLTRAVLQGETSRGVQLVVVGSDGRKRTVLESAAPICDAAGLPAGGVAVFQDISALHDLERQKDEFLASVSHDLKTPATIIRGHASILSRAARNGRQIEPGTLAEGFEAIDESVGRIVRLVDEMLDLTRLRMGQELELELGPTDLGRLVSRVVAEYRLMAPRHSFRLELPPGRVLGDWDEQRIERVVGNLLSNAVKYSSPGRTVEVSGSAEEIDGTEWGSLSVADEGIGIPPDDLGRVFEPYVRGTNVPANVSGTGVGLAGTRYIVERHGGRIDIESAVGQGTRVTVRLPLLRERIETF